MAWSYEDLDALDTAIKGNAKRVKFADGRETENHSLKEMVDLRGQMKAELAASASQINPIPRATRGRMRRS